jgi:hypothetical protein
MIKQNGLDNQLGKILAIVLFLGIVLCFYFFFLR